MKSRCPVCYNVSIWNTLTGVCLACGCGSKRKPIPETTKSTLRTVFSMLSFVVQLVALHLIYKYR
jgi:hypothetical protein